MKLVRCAEVMFSFVSVCLSVCLSVHGEYTKIVFLLPARKLRQSNIFTSMCQEFCPQGGTHGRGVHSRGHTWQGMHEWQGGMHGRGECMAGESKCGRGHSWHWACMAGGRRCVTGRCAWWGGGLAWQRGHLWQGGMHGGAHAFRGSMRTRNPFLFLFSFCIEGINAHC